MEVSVHQNTRMEELKTLYSDPRIQTWSAIYGTYKTMMIPLETALQEEKCSFSRLQIMFQLYFHGGKLPAELASSLNVSRANISTFIKRLINDEVVCSMSDAKRPKYTLTPKGIEEFERYFPKHLDRIKKLIPTASNEIITALEDINTSIEKKSNIKDSSTSI